MHIMGAKWFDLKVWKLLQKSSNSCHQILCNLVNICRESRVMSDVAVACTNWIVYEQYACNRNLMHTGTQMTE